MIQNVAIDPQRLERLGPAERVIQTLTNYTDHAVHNRPGYVTRDTSAVGVKWEPCTWKAEGDPAQKVVYKLVKDGKKSTKVRLGVLGDDGQIREGGRVVGEYRQPGLFPEVVVWMYRQIADVFRTDNEFAAKFASWAFPREHRDLKVVLAAFMLVQERKGDPILDAGKVAFYDDDYRDVGEAMLLLRDKGGKDFNPKLLLRVAEVLELPGVATINRELGFGKSAREAFLGRWPKAVQKWLRYREQNPKVLEGLVKAGFGSTVRRLASKVGYKPETEAFYQTLRWKQKQADDGRRTLAIGTEIKAAESWAGLSEREICERITANKPGWKRIVGLLPKEVGLTRAIVVAAVEAGSVSDTDLIILTPTLEELDLLKVPAIQGKHQAALAKAEDTRAANIAKRVKSAVVAEKLQEAADKATAKAMEEVTKDLRVYVVVDKSGSMEGSLEAAKGYLAQMVVGFPLERLHISVFNSFGSEVVLKEASKAAVEQAFRGHKADGSTSYAEGVKVLLKHKPLPGEDVLIIFVGDEGDSAYDRLAAEARKLNPVAFGLLKVPGQDAGIITRVAGMLNIPCLRIDTGMFNDPYAVTRTLRHLIATTPVAQGVIQAARPARKTLVQEILETGLLAKPVWASAA